LAGIHATPEFVTGCPEGGVDRGFLEGHRVLPKRRKLLL
jgi:hypothetical protein